MYMDHKKTIEESRQFAGKHLRYSFLCPQRLNAKNHPIFLRSFASPRFVKDDEEERTKQDQYFFKIKNFKEKKRINGYVTVYTSLRNEAHYF